MSSPRARALLFGLAVLALIAAGCSEKETGPRFTGGLSSCDGFKRHIAQFGEVVSTDLEARRQVKEIRDIGSTAELAIRTASADMLVASKEFDVAGWVIAINQMAAACTKHGY